MDVATRRSGDKSVTFVLNLGKQTKQLSMPAGDYTSALTDRRFGGGSLELEVGGVEILVES